MQLPGEGQVVFELRQGEGDKTVVHHIAFKADSSDDVAALQQRGVVFKTVNAYIADTGRSVSSAPDYSGQVWQLTD